MCGCGRTSTVRGKPAWNCAGPIWSKKMNGPTIRCEWNGSTRPTSNPPRSLRRWSMTSSIMEEPLVARGLSLRAHIGADQAEGRGGGVLYRADDDAALDVGDQAQRQDPFAQEVVEGVHVAGARPQLIMGGAGDGGALHHLGQLGDRGLEGVEVVLGGQAELDGAIDLESQAQFLAVQDGHPALGDARILQPLDAPPARAGGQSD